MTDRPAGRQLSAPLANVRADRVRQVAALAGRSARRKAGLILVEGPQAVRELVAHRAQYVRDIYVDNEAMGSQGAHADIAAAALHAGLFVHPTSAEVTAALSADGQGIVAVAAKEAIASAPVAAGAALVAILANVRDPGNAGTAIRVADAAGADAVILAGESVDPTNPKVIRSTAGSLFHVPVITGPSVAQAVADARAAGLTVLAADVSGAPLGGDGVPALAAPTAWLFGNEAWGLDPAELALADHAVRIPIYGLAESLNLGTAVAVCLYASAFAQRP